MERTSKNNSPKIDVLTFQALFFRYCLNKDYTDVYDPESASLFVELLGEVFNQAVN